jgi:hypothetical protein
VAVRKKSIPILKCLYDVIESVLKCSSTQNHPSGSDGTKSIIQQFVMA